MGSLDLSVSVITLTTIAVMALATYAMRAGGFALVRRLPPSRFLEAWLRHVPGAMFMALIAPAGVFGGEVFWAGAAVSAVLAWRRAPLALTLVAGAATVALLRLIL